MTKPKRKPQPAKKPAPTRKAPPKQPKLVTPPHGNGKIYAGGVPGNKGGRPPNEFVTTMRELASSPAVLKSLAQILNDPEHKQFAQLWAMVADRGYGRPKESLQLTGDLTTRAEVRFVAMPEIDPETPDAGTVTAGLGGGAVVLRPGVDAHPAAVGQ